MNRRMDAHRALKNLNKFRMHGKQITMAWAPGKGMKDKQWKDYWDVDLGVSYIPIDKLDPQVATRPTVVTISNKTIKNTTGEYGGARGRWHVR